MSRSLVEHLLCRLLELTATLVDQLLLLGLLLSQGRDGAPIRTVIHDVRSSVAHGALTVELLRIVAEPFILSFHCRVALVHARTPLAVRLVRRLNHWGLATAHTLLGIGRRCLLYRVGGFLPNDVEHGVFEGFLVLAQSVLFPGVVHELAVVLVALHARIEQPVRRLVVGFLVELQRSALVHELLEFVGLSAAKILKRRFNFLLLDVVVLLILGTAWESLPGQRSLE